MRAPAHRDQQAKPGSLLVLALLLCVLALGLGLRLYRLGDESIDFEEYVNVGHLDAPNLAEYIQQLRHNDPSTAPLPFALVYEWAKVFGRSPVSTRMVSVVLGELTVLLTFLIAYYFLGRGAFGLRAGLVAALCSALSPPQVFFSQEVRFYALLNLLAPLSFYCMMRGIRDRRWQWWALNIALNVLIPWTHLLGWVVLFTQGLILLALRLVRIRSLAAWSAIQLVTFVPWIQWVRTTPVDSFKHHYSFIPNSGWMTLVFDYFGDDVLRMAAGGGNPTRPWPFLPAAALGPMLSVQGYFDRALFAAGVAAACWLLYRLARGGDRLNLLVLAAWFVVPVATLWVLSLAWQPCAMPRYVSYHAIALYVILGGAVASMPWRALRGAAWALLVALFLYQDSLMLPGPVRTDWRGAGQAIREKGSPDDILLNYGALYLPMLLYNMNDPVNPSAAVQTWDNLPKLIDRVYLECARSTNTRDHGRNVWTYVLKENDYTGFEKAMKDLGYAFEAREIGGERGMWLYHFQPKTEAPPAAEPVPALRMDTLARALAPLADSPRIKAFHKAISWDSDDSGGVYVRLAIKLARANAVELASAFFHEAVAINPAYALRLDEEYLRALTGEEDWDNAAKKLAAIAGTNNGKGDPAILAAWADTLSYIEHYDEALARAQEAVALDPDYLLAQFALWRAHVGRKDVPAAQQALKTIMEKDAALAATLGPLLRGLLRGPRHRNTAVRVRPVPRGRVGPPARTRPGAQGAMTTRAPRKGTTLVVLAALMLAGLVLRAHHLPTESVDLEEYVSASHLDAPGLVAFIQQVRATDPPIAPLPFALIYGWSRIVGPSVPAIRALFVALGLLLIPLLFLFTYDLYGRTRLGRDAGLVAAACAALSPTHVFYAQEMRHTTLFTLFALASVYALLQATRNRGRGWWVLNVAVNGLLVWTHMMGVILLFVEGVFLLAFHWRRFGRLLAWGAAHGLLLAPYVLWAKTVPVQTVGAAFSFLTRPGFYTFWTDFIADDVINLGYPFKPQVTHALSACHGVPDWLLIGISAAAVAWGAWRAARKWLARGDDGPAASEQVLVLLLFAGPALFLLAASYAWLPCLCTRYSIYSSLFLYVLIGGLVAAVPLAPARWAAAGLVVALFGYQLSLALPGPIRTDWRGVVAQIHDEGAPGDVILAYSPFYLPVLQFNLGKGTHPCAAAVTHEGLGDLVAFCAANGKAAGAKNAWAYVLKEHDPAQFEKCLAARNIPYSVRRFGGERMPSLYRVEVGNTASAAPPPSLLAFARSLRRNDPGQNPRPAELGRVIRWDPDEAGAAFMRLGMSAAAIEGYETFAALAFEEAIRRNPAWIVHVAELNESMHPREDLQPLGGLPGTTRGLADPRRKRRRHRRRNRHARPAGPVPPRWPEGSRPWPPHCTTARTLPGRAPNSRNCAPPAPACPRS